MKNRLFGFWLNNPWFDLPLPALILIIWWFPLGHPVAAQASTSTALVALSAASGIILAVAALSVGMLYQSSNPLTVEARLYYGGALRRTFTWIFLLLLTGSLLPILGTVLLGGFEAVAAAIAIFVGSVIALVMLRVLGMLRLIMRTEHAGEEQVRPPGQKIEYRRPGQ